MEQILNIQPLQAVILTAGTIGAIELTKAIVDKNIKVALIILASVLVGSLLCLSIGISWQIGMVIGLNSSGIYKLIIPKKEEEPLLLKKK